MVAAIKFENVHAVLVHESPECVSDLVANLRHLDPASTVLLYDGSGGQLGLASISDASDSAVLLHPSPRRMEWGRLHEFAVDVLRFTLTNTDADTVTIVDSDQLALRSGYSAYLGAFLHANPGIGMLGSTERPEPPTTQIGPAQVAWSELELWRPLLDRFSDRRHLFPWWTFWPSTVFTRAGARAIADLYDDPTVQRVLGATRMWATEEVVLPALVALAGLDIVKNPCSHDYVRFRRTYTASDVDAAMRRADAFWLHPVRRHYDDPVRAQVRAKYSGYAANSDAVPGVDRPRVRQPLTMLSVLRQMEGISGWLTPDEADLLAGSALQALTTTPAPHHVVEIGSYCGRSTVVLGSVAQAVDQQAMVYAVDPHEGTVSVAAGLQQATTPTFSLFLANIVTAGLIDVVVPVKTCSYEVDWEQPICLLFIDALHDYVDVACDFSHFERWLVPGALVAFHDYSEQFPGVKSFVDHLLATGAYESVGRIESIAVVRRKQPLELPSLRSLLDQMERIRGWFDPEEAALLALATRRAIAGSPDPGAIVEVGSYCGRATVVLARAAAATRLSRLPPIVAVDTFDGVVGSADAPIRDHSTLEEFRASVAEAGVTDIVETLVGRAPEVPWEGPIAFLLIDGLHDYGSVAADFGRFDKYLVPGGLLAFHDFAPYWPGVCAFVADLERTSQYRRFAQIGSLVVFEKGRDLPSGSVAPRPTDVTLDRTRSAPREPLVSCIMPTFNRPAWVERAVMYFLRQDYQARELIVIDDGSEPVDDLLPSDCDVRLVRLEERASIGTKRNFGCEQARGEIIAHWDDDDWYAPWRLRYQVGELLRGDADVVGLSTLLYWEPHAHLGWRYHHPSVAQPWVHDPTFCYRRELWRRCPFPDTSHGIDTEYLWRGPSKRVAALDDLTFYVGIIHAGNTSAKGTANACWRPCPSVEVEAVLGDDASFDGSSTHSERSRDDLEPVTPESVLYIRVPGYRPLMQYPVEISRKRCSEMHFSIKEH
jgi:predicted O-methyltransferase YrrM